MLRRWWPAVAGLLVLGLAFAVPLSTRSSATPRSTATPSPPVSVAPPAVEAVVTHTAPARGRAVLVAGPFTDRLRLQRLALRSPVVSGSFAQVADNSALIVMEVQADFFDGHGVLLGSRKTVLRQPDVVRAAHGGTGANRYGGDVVFTVTAPQTYASRVSSALVSVPTLVSE